VTVINSETSYFANNIDIQNDVTIYPNVFIGSNTYIESNSIIHSFSHIEGAIIENGSVKIIHSSFRNQIPAVLILKDQKTYGRSKTMSGKQGKLLYKCVPDCFIMLCVPPHDAGI
jgi:NDP-sugar pyrophosphorylase family protein